jgi:hypothetical protein
MGRIRTVKPELFSHEELYEAEIESGLPLRIAYVGLFTVADREGRFKWRPRTLKLAVLPYDEVDFSRVLDALMTRGFIVKYANETGEFGYIPSFSKHQVINNRESASDLPDPKECPGKSVTSTREPRVNDASTTPLVHAQGEGKGREGTKEGKEKTPVGQKPDDATGKSESETVEKVFAYWQQTMNSPKSVLDKKRRDVIKRALQSYSPRDLCLAIKGCSLTPHNMGDNERATKFNGIHVCLRDADQIDRFIGACSAAPKSGAPQTKAEAVVAKNAGLGDALAASMGVAAGSPPNDGMTFEME